MNKKLIRGKIENIFEYQRDRKKKAYKGQNREYF
jgi:hypothetical protein